MHVLLCMALGTLVLFAYQAFLWPQTTRPTDMLQASWSWGAVLWLGAVIPGALGMVGLITFRHPRHLDTVHRMEREVSWRICSKGSNIEALATTIRRCQREMQGKHSPPPQAAA